MTELVLVCDLLLIGLLIVLPMYKENKKVAYIEAIVAVIVYVVTYIVNSAVAIVVLSLINGILVACEFVRHFIKNKKMKHGEYVSLAIALVLSLIYAGYSYYVAENLLITRYSYDVGSDLKIVQISDIHYGLVANPDKVKEIVDKANAEKPDVIVLTGDIFDEHTSLKKLEEGIALLEELDAPLGVYYIEGNHECMVDGSLDLYGHINKSSITLLLDKGVILNDEFVLIGRGDYSCPRMTVKSILEKMKLDKTYKFIVLDHQPVNYNDLVAECEPDPCLMLSGHTHGGQLFPVNFMTNFILSHDDELMYGEKTIGDTHFIVSSGATGGVAPLKNMTISEIVVIELH